MIYRLFFLLFIISSNLIASQFNWVADSVVINQTSIHRFERNHKQYDKTLLEYQVYAAKIWPNIKDKVSDSYKKNLVLTPVRARNFINVLKSRNRHEEIVLFINLQRDVLDSGYEYAEQLVEAYINISDNTNAQKEIEKASLQENVNYPLLKNNLHRTQQKEDYCEICFKSFKISKSEYNKLRLLHFYYTKKKDLAKIISSEYDDNLYDDIISEVILSAVRDSLPKDVVIDIYEASLELGQRAYTIRLRASVYIYTQNFSQGYEIFDSMDPRMRSEFLESFADSMFFHLGHNKYFHITDKVPVNTMKQKSLRYLYASYKLESKEKDFIDRILPNISDRDIHSYFYFWHTLLAFTHKDNNQELIEKYLTTRVNDVHYNDFLLWSTIIKAASSQKRSQLNAFINAFLTYEKDSVLKYVDTLKQYGIEYEILLSFPESEFREVKYTQHDIYRWYNALKYIDSGRFLMLLSEQFFSQNDLYIFYKEHFDREENPLWQNFIGSRLTELSSYN